MGIAEKAMSQGKTVNGISILFNGKTKVRLDLKNMGKELTRFPSMLMLEQSKTEQLLIDFLKESGHRVERETEMVDFTQDANGVVAVLKLPDGKEEIVKASYLVAADGGQSAIRSKLGILFIGKTNQKALCIMDCQADVDLAVDEICFSFSGLASAGFFPISGNRWRIDATFANGTGKPLTFQDVKNHFSKKVPIPLKLNEPDWFSVFHSHQRYAASFSKNRCFLLGDAAHLYSPVGAQGMNSGLQDAHNLAWKLALVIQKKAGPAILASYEAERKPLAVKTSKATNWFFKLAASDHLFYKTLRLKLLPIVLKSLLPLLSKQKIENFIFKKVSGTGGNYRKSLLTGTETGLNPSTPKPGERLPFVVYGNVDGDLNIQEQVSGTAFQLFVFSKVGEVDGLAQLVKSYSENITVQFIPFHPGTKNLYRQFGIKSSGWYLVRPDGYIACCSHGTDPAELKKYVKRVLILKE
jgi:2-polyprenyl-6-methoxyphenol hydroxylase-like FAD-dependent oxidoreductase